MPRKERIKYNEYMRDWQQKKKEEFDKMKEQMALIREYPHAFLNYQITVTTAILESILTQTLFKLGWSTENTKKWQDKLYDTILQDLSLSDMEKFNKTTDVYNELMQTILADTRLKPDDREWFQKRLHSDQKEYVRKMLFVEDVRKKKGSK